VEALHAWLVDPDEDTRIPRRLHDLVEQAEAEHASLADAPGLLGLAARPPPRTSRPWPVAGRSSTSSPR
jgi:dGTPase